MAAWQAALSQVPSIPKWVVLEALDCDTEMIEIVFKSDPRGPIGIIGHQRSAGAKTTLQAMDRLHSIFKEIGDGSGFSTY